VHARWELRLDVRDGFVGNLAEKVGNTVQAGAFFLHGRRIYIFRIS
jgi:hypothetical protein